MEKKYIYIKTFGCQMNVHDSEKILTLMAAFGYEKTGFIGEADLIVINTCSIRDKAEQKAHSEIGRLRVLKKKRPDVVIGVGGCLAQQKGEDFLHKYAHLDFVFGTHNISSIPQMIKDVKEYGRQMLDTRFHESVKSLEIMPIPEDGKVTAFITIMQGCNNFCTYCVVPYLRGKEESRPLSSILDEAKALAECGIKEVTLLGQNVNSYGKSNGCEIYDFTDLLYGVAQIPGIERIRFTTSHPKDLSEGLMNCFAEVEKLCEHIHLPVQSGSDRVLSMMNRNYTASEYIEKVKRLRKKCPSISITSDVIVGFPGETEADFKATLELMGIIGFDGLFSFKYSRRETTSAPTPSDTVPEAIKSERLRILQSVQAQHTLMKNKENVGKVMQVLVEGFSKNSRKDMFGRTRTNKIVNFKGGAELVGKTVTLLITDAYQHSLRGELFLN